MTQDRIVACACCGREIVAPEEGEGPVLCGPCWREKDDAEREDQAEYQAELRREGL